MASTLSIELRETGTSVANNTSTVSVVVKITTTNSWNLYSPYGQITFSGNLGGTYGWNHGFDRNTTTTLWSGTFTVAHNADGTGSFSASAYVDTDIAEGRIWASASLNLTTIPRASKPTLTGQPGDGDYLGEKLTINMNRASSSFTHTVRWNWADHQGIIAENVGASVVWTPPLSMAAYLTAETRARCTISVNTYNGDTFIGTQTMEFTLSIPSSVVPSVTGVSFTDASNADEGFGVILAGVSDLTAKIAASGAYGSSIVKAAIKFAGLYQEIASGNIASGVWIGTPVQSGLQTVTATVTDSRGRQTTYTGQVLVYGYQSPSLTGTTAYRFDPSTGHEDDESTSVRVRVKGVLGEPDPAGQSGAQVPANSATVTVQWMQRGGTAWTTANTSKRSGSFDYTVDLSGTFSELSAYVVRVTVTDLAGKSVSMDIVVGTAQPVIDLKATGDGIAFLGISNKKGIRANGIVHLTQDGGIDLENEAGESQAFVRPQANGRPTIMNHAALANGIWLQGQLSGGTFANLLSVNASDQVELGWTVGGLRGRVHKELWSGDWSRGATLTLSEHRYYNELLVWIASADYPIPVYRTVTGDATAWFQGGGLRCSMTNANQILAIGVWITVLVNNPNVLMLERCQVIALGSGSVGSISTNKIVKIEGVL